MRCIRYEWRCVFVVFGSELGLTGARFLNGIRNNSASLAVRFVFFWELMVKAKVWRSGGRCVDN